MVINANNFFNKIDPCFKGFYTLQGSNKMAVVELTQDTMESFLETNKDKTVLIDFWASWCAPCKQLLPVVEKLAEENQDIVIAKVQVDVEEQLSNQYKVRRVPTFIALKDGKRQDPLIAKTYTKDVLQEYIDKHK